MKIDSDQWRQTVIEGAEAVGVTVSLDQARALGQHARELLQWNRITNLTAITGPLEVAIKHYVDSVAVSPWIDRSARVLDAGSGGGFPGIPLKVVRPDLSIIMVDGVRKKISFLKHAIRQLGLGAIGADHGRLEDLGRLARYSGQFDVVVCRAFASLETFVAQTAAYLAPGGRLLAMKGPQAGHDREVRAAEDDGIITLSGRQFSIHIHRYRLPRLNSQRSLIRLAPMP